MIPMTVHSVPYVPLSNNGAAPGPAEAIIPVTFQNKQIGNAEFDGVSYNFTVTGNLDNALISGALVYVPRYVDVAAPDSPAGKRRLYTEIEILAPQFAAPRGPES